MYGNIGVPERLAFSAVGPTVIEVARIEKLTKTVGARVLATREVAALEPHLWRSIGEHRAGGRRPAAGALRLPRGSGGGGGRVTRVSAAFRYEELPVFDAFERVSDPAVYTPLPDDWHVGVADVVKSTEALKAGRYKAVNMAGASVVGAVRNALGTLSFPFVFGGDGAVLAVPPEAPRAARAAMAATANFVADGARSSTLRVGMLPVAAIRAAGHDMRVARYAASPEAVYAMFSGGGASYAESGAEGRPHRHRAGAERTRGPT